MDPQLAANLDIAHVNDFLEDDRWCIEQKLDGQRLIVSRADGRITGYGRRRHNIDVPTHIERAFDALTFDVALDGELVRDTFWVFDLLHLGTQDFTDSPYQLRNNLARRVVDRLQSPSIQAITSAQDTERKIALCQWALDNSVEGIMVKDLEAPYLQGRRHAGLLKGKFVKTCDVVVLEPWKDGKRAARIGVYDGETMLDVGSVSCTEGLLDTLKVDDVLECLYLYATDERKLYQPRVKRQRFDKLPTECTSDQLVFTNKSTIYQP